MEDGRQLYTMNFQPPLQHLLVPSSVTYLAYAPAEVRDPTEHAQVDALNQSFGPTTGTFDWNGRSYLYTAVHQLPCASAPAQDNRMQALSANVTDGPRDQGQFRAKDWSEEQLFQ